MKLKICIFLLFSNTLSFGQILDWSWAKSAGGDSGDQAQGLTTDLKGNVYVTGEFYSSSITFDTCTFTNTVNNFCDMFITKYNAFGNVIWAKSVGGSSLDFGRSTTTDQSGNLYITGNFYSPYITIGNYTLTNASSPNSDVFVAKYDSLGNVLWAKSFGGSNHDVGNSITSDNMGNVYLTGVFYSTKIIIGADTLTNTDTILASGDGFVVKYSSTGNILWAKGFGGSKEDMTNSITTDPTGNVYLTGRFESSNMVIGTDTLTNAGVYSHDIFIAKYNSTGNVLWTRSAGGDNFDDGESVKTDASGNVFITGQFESTSINFGNYTLTNAGGRDIFIVKYDSAGNVQWAKREGGDLYDIGRSLAISSDGNIYLTGTFRNTTLGIGAYSLINANNTGTDDIFVIKYNTSGNVLGVSSAGGGGNDYPSCIASDPFGNIYIAGEFRSQNVTFGGTVLTISNNSQNGNPDIFIAKIGTLTGINTLKKETSLDIFPNPSDNYINISFSQQDNTSITINLVDIQGKVIFKENKSQSLSIYKSTIDLRDKAKGIYFLQIFTTSEMVTRKIILN